MNAEELPDQYTAVDANPLGAALVAAWRKLFGVLPARESILVLMAQSALETGRWKACHNWNLGNVKSYAGDGRCFTLFACTEVIAGHVVHFTPPDPACRFRAFHTLDEGAIDYLGFLHGLKRYQAAWAELIAGDAAGFVHQLKAGGYFTADEGQYAHNVVSLFHEYAKLPFQVAADEPVIDDETRERVMGLVALSLSEIARADTDRPPDTLREGRS
jgi:hypothetical protein